MSDERVNDAFQRNRTGTEDKKEITANTRINKGDKVLVVFDGSIEEIHRFVEKANNAGAEVIVEFTPPR